MNTLLFWFDVVSGERYLQNDVGLNGGWQGAQQAFPVIPKVSIVGKW